MSKNIILRISGTFGSGKTTSVRQFLNGYPSEELRNSANKIMGYKVDASSVGISLPIYVVGKYDNVCGGTDAITTQKEIADRVLAAHKFGHVVYEGALVSGSGLAGAVTMAVHETGCDVYAFLNTPQDVCIERVIGRRAAAGNEKEFNPKNLVHKFVSVVNTYKALKAEGYTTHMIDYTDPHPALVSIIKDFES